MTTRRGRAKGAFRYPPTKQSMVKITNNPAGYASNSPVSDVIESNKPPISTIVKLLSTQLGGAGAVESITISGDRNFGTAKRPVAASAEPLVQMSIAVTVSYGGADPWAKMESIMRDLEDIPGVYHATVKHASPRECEAIIHAKPPAADDDDE